MKPLIATSVRDLDLLLMSFEHLASTLVSCTARAAADVTHAESWISFGYRNRDDFSRELLGRSAKWLRKMSVLHDALCAYPELRQAIEGTDGKPALRRAAAVRICFVLTPETATRWIEQARRLTVRELNDLVRQERQRVASTPKSDEKSQFSRPDDTSNAHNGMGNTDGVCEAHSDGPQTVHLRLQAPPEVHVAFEEALDLHSAVSGRSVSTRGFVEALVAEACAGRWSPAKTSLPAWAAREWRTAKRTLVNTPVDTGRRRALLEKHSTTAWPTARTAAMHRALAALARITQAIEEWRSWAGEPEASASGAMTGMPTTGEFVTGASSTESKHLRDLARVHMLRTFLALENEIKIRAADLLVDLCGEAPWRALGFSGLAEYAQERLGWGPSSTYRRVRLARKTRHIEVLRRAYEAGRVGVEAATWVVRHLSRDAGNAKTQGDWVQHAASTTVKRLRDEDHLLKREVFLARALVAQQVSHAAHSRAYEYTERPSGLYGPSVQPDPSSRRGRSVQPDPSGRRGPSAQSDPGRRGPSPRPSIPTDASWREFIGRAPGRSQDLVVSLGSQLLHRVGRRGAQADLALGLILPKDLATDLWGCLEAARVDLQMRASRLGCVSVAAEARLTPGERIARDYRERGQPVPHWVGLFVLLEDYVRTWDAAERTKRRGRDAIHNRDGWRCTAPGCTSRRNLQTHHIQHRARGGDDAPDNLQDLCAFHHLRGVHGGLSQCSGQAPLDVVWRLGTSQLGVWFQNERKIAPPAAEVRHGRA